jgi:phosphoenolpyruvate carboxylase
MVDTVGGIHYCYNSQMITHSFDYYVLFLTGIDFSEDDFQVAELTRDIELLDSILGKAIRSLEPDGEQLCQLVNQIIQQKDKQTEKIISSLSNNDALRVSRVLSHYLNLANVAEQHHKVRRSRYHQVANKPLIHSCEEIFKSLVEEGIPKERIYGMLLCVCYYVFVYCVLFGVVI